MTEPGRWNVIIPFSSPQFAAECADRIKEEFGLVPRVEAAPGERQVKAVEWDARRWYVVVTTHYEEGGPLVRVIYDPDRSGLVVYESLEEFERARDG
jgi:hypothetical protein